MTATIFDSDLDSRVCDAPAFTATVVVVCSDAAIVRDVERAERIGPGAWQGVYVDDHAVALEVIANLERVDMFIVQVVAGEEDERFLRQLRNAWPSAARLVLYDGNDQGALASFAPLAHQAIPAPVDPGLLQDMVQRVHRSSDVVLGDPVRTLVGQADRLPSPPSTFLRINEILASDDWRMADLVAEISQDVASTSEIFKLVNSSYYGTGAKVTTIDRAISMIGQNLTCFILLGNSMFQSGEGFQTWIDLDRLGARSTAVAQGARALAMRERDSPDASATAYLAGLVSEIGLLVLARIPDISRHIAAPVNDSVFLGAERVLFGGDRFEVGARLLSLWGFDEEVIECTRALSSGEESEPGSLAWYVATSRRLVVGHDIDPGAIAAPGGFDPEFDRLLEELMAAQSATSVNTSSDSTPSTS